MRLVYYGVLLVFYSVFPDIGNDFQYQEMEFPMSGIHFQISKFIFSRYRESISRYQELGFIQMIFGNGNPDIGKY